MSARVGDRQMVDGRLHEMTEADGWQPVDPDSLDAAWAEAEAALPEGGHMSLSGPYKGPNYHVASYSGRTVRAESGDSIPPYGVVINGRAVDYEEWIGNGDGPTPAAALRALAQRLREAQR